MTLVRTSILNAIATAIRILTSITLNKVLAVYVGPSGYALFGQFSNFVTFAGAFSGGAVATGVTKYTAEHYDNESHKKEIWRLSCRYVLVISLVFSACLVIFGNDLSILLLGSNEYRLIFFILAAALPLTSFNALLVAVINGQKDLNKFVYQNISASILGAMTSSVSAIWFGLYGALVALSVNQAVVLIATLLIVRKSSWFTVDSFVGVINVKKIRPMAGFILMALTTAATGPISQILVRNDITENFGEISAGEWQAVFKISEIYLLFFTSTLSVYYLPRISEIRHNNQLKLEILKVYKIVLPTAALIALLIYILRNYITTSLFTSEFLGMTQLFAWQLFGDVIKIGSWILGFVMVGRGMVRWFLLTEIVFSSSWVMLTFTMTTLIGLRGAPAAFAINYMFYWVFLIWLIRKKIN